MPHQGVGGGWSMGAFLDDGARSTGGVLSTRRSSLDGALPERQ